MLSRRERRQHSADMELGRRHPYFYGAGRLVVMAAAAAAISVALLVCWVVAPRGTLAGIQAAGWVLAGAVVCWLFWLVALRRR